MTPRERELLTGMGNCYEACHADFEGTVEMVANARRLTPADVKGALAAMRKSYASLPDYLTLRGRLPPSFPF